MTATYLLIHGAWHGSWCWDKVKSQLEQDNHQVIAPDLPGRNCDISAFSKITLQTHVLFLQNLIEKMPGKVILVGHSFAGIIASQLAENNPSKIAHIVYVAGFLPRNGQSLMDLATTINHLDKPAGMIVEPEKNCISVNPQTVLELFFNCCSSQDQNEAAALMCAEPLSPMSDKVSLSDQIFGHIPKTYIECSIDNAVTLRAQKIMQSYWPCNVKTLQTDHSPFISTPDELAEILINLDKRC